MTKAKNKCGDCGWMRKGVCLNPKSPEVDTYLGKAALACKLFHKIGTKEPAQ